LTEAALALRRALGDRHALGHSLIRRAVSLQNSARRNEALETLAEADPLLDPLHPATPMLRAEIDEMKGLAHLGEGRWAEAEEHFSRARSAYAQQPEEYRPQWLATNLGIARALAGSGRHREAEELVQPLVEQLRGAGEAQEFLLVSVLDTYGQLLYRQQRWVELEPLREQTLLLAEQHYGPDAWRTLIASNNLGVARLRQHKFEQALDPLQRAVAGAETILPKEHGFTIAAIFNLAEVEVELGLCKQALERYRSIQDLLDRNPDLNQPDRAQLAAQILRCEQTLSKRRD
jgi:tetratricopeptide (TPR) repeat protein